LEGRGVDVGFELGADDADFDFSGWRHSGGMVTLGEEPLSLYVAKS
jgi:hypothetical protein